MDMEPQSLISSCLLSFEVSFEAEDSDMDPFPSGTYCMLMLHDTM